MTVRGLLTFALFMVAPLAVATEPLAAVRAQLADPAVLRGHFEQEKAVAGFRNPLRSQGEFVLVRGRGVIWRVQAPFASTTVLSRGGIVSRSADGTDLRLDAAQTPALDQINRLLFAILAGDLEALAADFEIVGAAATEDPWRLELSPRDAPLRRALTRVALAGDRYVREVIIEETSGDRTRLEFTDLSQADAPGAAETAELDG